MPKHRELTEGEFKVGIDFNPSKNSAVNKIKEQAAALIDTVRELAQKHIIQVENTINEDKGFSKKTAEEQSIVIGEIKRRASEIGRLSALSVTNIETAAMQGVKAVTK